MDTRNRRFMLLPRLLALAAALGLYTSASAWAAEPQPGAWQPHKLTMPFLGISTTYSCDGLQDALTYLLKRIGAQLNGPVIPEPCIRGYGVPERLTQAQMSFSSLQPLAEATAASGPTVPGVWRHIVLSSQNSAPMLQRTDCELVDQFRQDILPLFATRNIKNGLMCIPYQESAQIYSLSFDVFVPVNAPGGRSGGNG